MSLSLTVPHHCILEITLIHRDTAKNTHTVRHRLKHYPWMHTRTHTFVHVDVYSVMGDWDEPPSQSAWRRNKMLA